jgi:hypothetical protein
MDEDRNSKAGEPSRKDRGRPRPDHPWRTWWREDTAMLARTLRSAHPLMLNGYRRKGSWKPDTPLD